MPYPGFPTYPDYSGYPPRGSLRPHRNDDADNITWYDKSGNGRNATVTNPYLAGYSTAASQAQSIGADKKYGFRVYIAALMTVTKFTAYLSNQGTGHIACNVRPVLYADSSGTPAALVASGTPVAVADNAAKAWVDLPISASLTAGFYWMFLHGDASAAGLSTYLSTTSGYTTTMAYNPDTYADGPDDPAGEMTYKNGRMSIYLTASDSNFWTGYGTATDPYAVVLNGTQQYAATSAFAQSSGEFTVEAWNTDTGNRIGYGTPSTPLAHGITNTDGWCWQEASAGALSMMLNRSGSAQAIALNGGVSAGTLTHLAFRCSNTGLTGRWSKNGVHQNAVALTAAMVPCASRSFYVGGYNAQTAYCAPWKFSAVRYYNRVLSDAEVVGNFNAGPHGKNYVKDSLQLDLNAGYARS